MSAFDRLVDCLRADGRKVMQSREGQAQAQCPAHDDRGPSLSVTRIEGQALVYCHASCATDDVMAALKLTTADLFDTSSGVSYRYDDGRTVIRSTGKEFRQKGITRGTGQLYRYAKVVEAVANGTTVYVVEGEKDVHALESIGQVATCSPMGAGKWHKVDPSPLHGANLVVVADKDDPGEKHARDIVESLTDKVQSIQVVHARIGKDAADHIAAGLDADAFDELQLHEKPALRRARITWADQIEPEPVVWAWKDGDYGRIPAGSLSVAAGREGTGKSSFAIWQAAQITRGTLPGSYFGAPRRVFYVAVEDSWKHTLVPRLMAAGADLSKVGRFDVVNYDDNEIMLSLPHDNALLEAAISTHAVALVVIDPLLSVIGEKINTHQSREVRSALDPLAKIADRTGSVLLGICHFNKGSGTDASSLITGSGAFKDVPRSVFGFVRDDSEDGGQRIMTQTKNSLGPDGPSLSYEIHEASVATKSGPAITSLFVFTGESDRSVQDVLRDARSGADPEEHHECAAWLAALLADGRVKANDVYRAADSAGYSKDQAKRAKRKIGVVAEKDDMTSPWFWRLANDEGSAKSAKGAGDAEAHPSHSSPLPSANTDAEQIAESPECPACERWGIPCYEHAEAAS